MAAVLVQVLPGRMVVVIVLSALKCGIVHGAERRVLRHLHEVTGVWCLRGRGRYGMEATTATNHHHYYLYYLLVVLVGLRRDPCFVSLLELLCVQDSLSSPRINIRIKCATPSCILTESRTPPLLGRFVTISFQVPRLAAVHCLLQFDFSAR